MIFKIRVVLDVKQDVIRTIAIEGSKTLEDLHNTIAQVFGFNGQQMASFYRTDDDWNQGEEIPLISMDESPNALSMSTTTIDQNIEDIGEKLKWKRDEHTSRVYINSSATNDSMSSSRGQLDES